MVDAYLLVKARHGKLKIAGAGLRTHEEIEEVHEVFGEWDLVAKVQVRSLGALKEYIQNKVQITEGVKETRTLICNDTDDFD